MRVLSLDYNSYLKNNTTVMTWWVSTIERFRMEKHSKNTAKNTVKWPKSGEKTIENTVLCWTNTAKHGKTQ